jgi:hypothetical protein
MNFPIKNVNANFLSTWINYEKLAIKANRDTKKYYLILCLTPLLIGGTNCFMMSHSKIYFYLIHI